MKDNMDELDMLESKVIPTDVFGRLFIQVVLLDYDYPRCFIAKNDQESFFALLENDDGIDSFGWNLTKISLNDIKAVNNGRNNVQSLFLEKESFLLSFSNNNPVGKITPVNVFEGKNRIQGSMFLPNFCEMDELFDFHNLQKISNKQKQTSISVVLENEIGSNTGVIFRIISYIKAICENLNNKINIFNSTFSSQMSSTVITFQFDDGPLFQNNVSQNYSSLAATELGNFLKANEPDQIIAETKNIKTVDKYSKLLKTFKKESNLKPKIVVAIPENDKVTSFAFSKTNLEKKISIVKEAQDIYKTLTQKTQKTIVVEGVLTGILTESNSQFSFKTNTGDIHYGTVDFSIIGKRNQFLINAAIYSATIQVNSIFYNDNLTKETKKLLQLKKISDLPQYEKIELF